MLRDTKNIFIDLLKARKLRIISQELVKGDWVGHENAPVFYKKVGKQRYFITYEPTTTEGVIAEVVWEVIKC